MKWLIVILGIGLAIFLIAIQETPEERAQREARETALAMFNFHLNQYQIQQEAMRCKQYGYGCNPQH